MGMDIGQNQLAPDTPGGILGGFRVSQNAKVWKIYQTAGPIGTKFGTRLRIHLGNGHRLKTISPSIHQRGIGGGGGLGVKNSKVCKIYQTVGPIGTKFGTRLQIHMGMVIG